MRVKNNLLRLCLVMAHLLMQYWLMRIEDNVSFPLQGHKDQETFKMSNVRKRRIEGMIQGDGPDKN